MSMPPALDNSGLPEPTADDKMMALIAHLSMFVGAVIVPAILIAVKGESPFVKYHAMQALVFQIGVVALNVVLYVLYTIITIVTFGFGSICFPMVCIGMIFPFVAIFYAIKANNGEWQGYPLISGIGRPA
jgi:uncharacterized Tic20 family protein